MNMMRMVVVCSVALLAACGKVTTTKPDGGTAADGGSGGGTGGGTGGGSGGGGGNVAVCGDGTKAATEACDDGNKMADDGCSAACTIEAGWNCTGSPKSTCTLLNCGNGTLDSGEQCDDGNSAAGDGCSASCSVEPGYEIEPNDESTTANEFAQVQLNGAVIGRVAVSGDKDVFKLVVPAGATGSFRIAIRDGGGKSCFKREIDSELTLTTETGTSVTGGNNDDIYASGGYCSLLSFTDPAPGTYYLEVAASDFAEAPDDVFPYTLVVANDTCGDGTVGPTENCDDGNATGSDGCSSKCFTEDGYTCNGTTCTETCGNGAIDGFELCDDGNTNSFDGCSSACRVESGYDCTGTPSQCVKTCGNGTLEGSDQCDDNNTSSNDGCSSSCRVESGWACTGTPSTCVETCGNGTLEGSDKCDDGNKTSGDGCSSSCSVEYGYACSGSPSTCQKACGNGVIDGSEGCDDQNTTAGDGCSAFCNVESNFTCSGAPSVCTSACNVATSIAVPSGSTPTTVNGSFPQAASAAAQYFSFTLTQPATVSLQALNGSGGSCASSTPALDLDLSVYESDCSTSVKSEFANGCPAMDLQNLAAGTYYVRAKIYPTTSTATAAVPFQLQLSIVLPGCGNNRVEPGEQCDDGNTTAGDGCSDTCQREGAAVNETEPNDWSCTSSSPVTCTFASGASANAVSGNVITVVGDHSLETDSDVFAIDLQQGASIRLEIVEGDASETCESEGIDSKVWLRNSSFATVISDDDDGRGYCSLIDGTGTTPADTAASNLPAGRYYIEVNKSGGTFTPEAGQFKYNLLIDVK